MPNENWLRIGEMNEEEGKGAENVFCIQNKSDDSFQFSFQFMFYTVDFHPFIGIKDSRCDFKIRWDFSQSNESWTENRGIEQARNEVKLQKTIFWWDKKRKILWKFNSSFLQENNFKDHEFPFWNTIISELWIRIAKSDNETQRRRQKLIINDVIFNFGAD